ncbi:sn-glycerol-3-phosphate transport system permease protein ugpA [uncultured Ruminococcus sp.]|uniref:carbohydrate ABC transporter permease n=1 Tax=Massiliimalia timonensis TaxID=1987501 RepID=UPI0008223E26|nr:sugar ABC transporter permease [Massiliimalia timonensis]SCH52252.1 sn-glycerol-3-phosphate transport system permease protein ugpA [uncultured Clostridium sp.]SCH62349.1 sn-glycerol-3-phosphate transport system permease protein ugpA [uncultured Ruminococcus sp.]
MKEKYQGGVNYGIKRRRKEERAAYIMLAPALIVFLIFVGIPIILLFFLFLTKYNITNSPEWSGLDNLQRFLTDPVLPTVYWNTFKFAAVLIPMHVIVGMILAYSVYRANRFMQYVGRTIIYFPTIVTTASVAIAWAFMYSTDMGVINYFLRKIGIEIPWLTSSVWSIAAIVIFSLWKFVGSSFLYLFVGLQGVPESLREAAAIDGANSRQTFFHIVLPLLTPTLFFVIITNVINSIQMFDEPYLITSGGPGDSSRTISLYIYERAFRAYEMGYASTLAISLFIILLVVTLLQFYISNKWVNYDR